MGKRTLEDIQVSYLSQFTKNEYKKVELSGDSTQQKSPFSLLFDEDEKYDLIQEVDKTILYQWLKENNDERFQHYSTYYFMPNEIISLKEFSYYEIYSIISPNNVESLIAKT